MKSLQMKSLPVAEPLAQSIEPAVAAPTEPTVLVGRPLDVVFVGIGPVDFQGPLGCSVCLHMEDLPGGKAFKPPWVSCQPRNPQKSTRYPRLDSAGPGYIAVPRKSGSEKRGPRHPFGEPKAPLLAGQTWPSVYRPGRLLPVPTSGTAAGATMTEAPAVANPAAGG
jgi:hypothetical protein